MSRRDGFPTNRELQVDLTTGARDLFVNVAERQLESKIDLCPAFEDKPLDHLYVIFSKKHDIPEGSPQVLQAERLYITPLQLSTANNLKYEEYGDPQGHLGNELFRDASDEVIDYYVSVAKTIGETLITNKFRFSKLPPSGVEADWKAEVASSKRRKRTRHVSSFRERPSKQSLVAAKFFLEEAVDYMNSDEFDKTMQTRLSDYDYGVRQDNPEYQMRHWLGFNFSPRLTLNGHEPKAFLEAYAKEMSSKLEYATERLTRLEGLNAPDIILDENKEIVARYQMAVNRATHYLEK